MSQEIHFYAVRHINEGCLEELEVMGQEAADYFEDHAPGTLEYEWYLDPGTMDCHLFERYADSAACLRHLEVWEEKFAARAHKLLTPKLMFVYGNPDDAVRAKLAGAKPVYCSELVGYRRF